MLPPGQFLAYLDLKEIGNFLEKKGQFELKYFHSESKKAQNFWFSGNLEGFT